MRDIQTSLCKIEGLRSKIQSCLKSLEKSDKLDESLKQTFQSLKSLEEVELVYAPYKTTRRTLADKAREAGLGMPVQHIIFNGISMLDLHKFVMNRAKEGLKSLDDVVLGMKYIFSDELLKMPEALQHLRTVLKENPRIQIQCSKSTSKSDDRTAEKFENYYQYSGYVSSIQPHQILAINRAENLKVLTVKLMFPDFIENKLKYFVRTTIFAKGVSFRQRSDLFEECWTFSYGKKIQPLMTRLVRAELKERAEQASVQVFASNLKQLLLTPPVAGERILAIDPGFKHGSKCAMISEQNAVLETLVLHNVADPVGSGRQLGDLLKRYKCKIVALGNGKGCREVETWITALIQKNIINDNVRYCIVNEQGASIYSCSDEAKKEFPDLDINLIRY